MSRHPAMVRQVRHAPLPSDVLMVLEIVSGEAPVLEQVEAETGLSGQQLREAAGFFVEQVLFNHRADSYRILGVDADVPTSEIRRHVALLMKWLHPDTSSDDGEEIDRSVFVSRVTQAWDDLKTDERRQAYDRSRVSKRKSTEPADRRIATDMAGVNAINSVRPVAKIRRVPSLPIEQQRAVRPTLIMRVKALLTGRS